MESPLNILIPMAGSGQHFHQEGYLCPKPLVKILGTPIIDRLLSCLKLHEKDTVYIPHMKYLETTLMLDIFLNYFNIIHIYDDFGACKLTAYGKGKCTCIIIELELPTRGASETLLLACKLADKNLPLISLDCDNVYKECPLQLVRTMRNSAIFYFPDTQTNPIYSYIRINEGEITEIREKEKISDLACSGGYYFSSTALAIKYAEMAQKSCLQNKELFISNLYSSMISAREIIIPIQVIPQSFGIPMAVETYAKNNIDISEKKTFCFDLDSTILSIPLQGKDYSTCQPITETINFIQYLYSAGNEIIIYTARGMLTYNGNTQIIENTYKIPIENILKKYMVPYHRLIFGKPYADFYIDDKAVSTFSNFGRETGFYPDINPSNMRNKMKVENNFYVKEGNLSGEYYWYRNIDKSIQDLFVELYPSSSPEKIITPKINGITFSEKFIGRTLTITHLQALMHSLDRVHSSAKDTPEATQATQEATQDIYNNYLPKLEERMGAECDTELYINIRNGLENYKQTNSGFMCVIHGDPVFTNIFLTDTYTIKFIDMRGKQGDTLTIFGDRNYDYSKIYQSLTGYDAILHDKTLPNNMGELLAYFENFMGSKMKWIYLITASLYYTLIPLHINESKEQISRYYRMAQRLIQKYITL